MTVNLRATLFWGTLCLNAEIEKNGKTIVRDIFKAFNELKVSVPSLFVSLPMAGDGGNCQKSHYFLEQTVKGTKTSNLLQIGTPHEVELLQKVKT